MRSGCFVGEFDMLILLTGVGTRALNQVLASRYPPQQFAEALRKITIVARGPKPAAALREMQVPTAVTVPEPNTWRELLGRHRRASRKAHRRARVRQEQRGVARRIAPARRGGDSRSRLSMGLARGHRPLREAARRLAAGEFDVALFTTSIQIDHLMRVAAEMGVEPAAREGLSRARIASIGPTTSEALEEFGFHPAMEPAS